MINFIEGFDIYGDDESELTDGVYLQASGGLTLSTTQARSGTYSLRHYHPNTGSHIRRGLGGEFTGIGMGFGLFIDEMPGGSNYTRLCDFRNDNNVTQVSVMLTSTGNITVWRNCPDFFHNAISGVELAATTSQPLVTDAWQHIEVQVEISETAGSFEIRVDGVTVLQGSSLDTIAQSSLPNINQVVGIGSYPTGTTGGYIYMDDWYCYDFTGTENNDWIGDRKVIALYPNDNGAVQDWTAVGASTEYDCIDESPADEDTTYIEAAASGAPHNAEFELEDLPAGIGAVTAIQTYVKAKKTDAAACNLQISMQSGSSEGNGSDRPITTAYTHWMDVFETDPSTGALWTPSGLDAASIDIERTL